MDVVLDDPVSGNVLLRVLEDVVVDDVVVVVVAVMIDWDGSRDVSNVFNADFDCDDNDDDLLPFLWLIAVLLLLLLLLDWTDAFARFFGTVPASLAPLSVFCGGCCGSCFTRFPF
jgi:hypothetical protein